MASMGPRARARGNPNHSGAGHSRDVLQWGHERALVEIGRSPFRGGRRTALQWGHERALVEMMFVNAPLTWSVELQWGHERALVEIRPIRPPRAAILGFNGATSARSWKSWRRSTRWRWRSGFNGATSARSWKWSEVGACGLLWFGLQWGHERALVEISTTNSWSRSTSALQWGHERALVEIGRRSRAQIGRASCRERV